MPRAVPYPETRYRVQNWPAYDAGLKRRGDLTLWLDAAALARWQAPRRTTPGGQARYSDAAIELVLMLRLDRRIDLCQRRLDQVQCGDIGKDRLYYIIQEFSLRPVVEIYVPGGRLADVRISDQAPR
jgi:Transposase DDE domain